MPRSGRERLGPRLGVSEWLASLALALALGGPTQAAPVRVAISGPEGRSLTGTTVRVLAELRANAGRPVERGRWETAVAGTGQAVLDLAPGLWTLQASAPGFWSPPVDVEVGAGAAAAAVSLWPAAMLSGRIAPAPGDFGPTQLEVRFQRSGGAGTVPELTGTLQCPVQGGRWRCLAPAGVFDLEVR